MDRARLAILALLAGIPAAATGQSVTTYHNGLNRHGLYIVPGLTAAAASTMRPLPGFVASFAGNLYAQPLYLQPKGATPARLIVATESNTVMALDATTGATLWTTALAPPMPLSGLGCGNIDPMGVTGTPVIDPRTDTLYVAAQTKSAAGKPDQVLYALSLADGSILPPWPLDVTAALTAAGRSFDPSIQGERGALLFLRGQVFIVYGGNDGDCGDYHGTVAQIDPATISLAASWQTRAQGGGIWAQGGLASDTDGLFITTGNTFNASSWGDGEAILRLRRGLAEPTNPADYYVPANWQSLDESDADLGGTEALPIDLPVAGGTTPRVIALGKDGNAYLANRADLGGIGGPASILAVSTTRILTAPAVVNTASASLVAFQNSNSTTCPGNSITMLSITTSPTTPIAQAWCTPMNGRGAPMITTTDGSASPIVWAVGAEGDNLLHGFDALTGAPVFTGGGNVLLGLHHFQTLIAAGSHLFVGADNTIYAFEFMP